VGGETALNEGDKVVLVQGLGEKETKSLWVGKTLIKRKITKKKEGPEQERGSPNSIQRWIRREKTYIPRSHKKMNLKGKRKRGGKKKKIGKTHL